MRGPERADPGERGQQCHLVGSAQDAPIHPVGGIENGLRQLVPDGSLDGGRRPDRWLRVVRGRHH
jgi:hypothetical protein